MNIRAFIRKTLLESIREATLTSHSQERIATRILQDSMPVFFGNVSDPTYIGTYNISDNIKKIILNNIKTVEDYNFDPNKSFAVLLFQFSILPSNVELESWVNARELLGKPLSIKDPKTGSRGNQLYAIVRDNSIETIMLTESYSVKGPQKFNVDYILKAQSLVKKPEMAVA